MPAIASEDPRWVMLRLVWLGLLHSVWLGVAIAAVVAVLLRAMPGLSHRVRHNVLAAALVVAAAGPCVLAIGQHAGLRRATRPVARAPEWTIDIQAGPSGRVREAGRPVEADRIGGAGERSHGRLLLRVLDLAGGPVRAARPAVLGTWSAAVTVLGLVLVAGGLRLRRLCREATPASTALRDRAGRLARRLRLRSAPRLLVHPRLAEPFLCGMFRPAILLPARLAAASSTGCLDAILAHELAHARRLDHLANLAQRLTDIVFCFHPSIRWLSRSLRRQREFCADALAVRLTGDPLALARALESVARLRLAPSGLGGLAASFGGSSSSLLPRIQELIGMMPPRPHVPWWTLASLPMIVVLAGIAVTAGFADDRPAAPRGDSRIESRPTAHQPPQAPKKENGSLIAYEVRYIVGPSEAWRERCLARMKLVKQDAELAAWLLDDDVLRDLLTAAQQDTRTNVLCAPKVSSHEGARATIDSSRKHFYVSGFSDLDQTWPGVRPVVGAVREGLVVELTGRLLPAATRLQVKAESIELLGMRTLSLKKENGGKSHSLQYQVPTTARRSFEVDCAIPDRTQLLISLGISDEPGWLPDGAVLANGVLGALGLPRFQPDMHATEKCIVITPRRVKPEENWPDRPRVLTGWGTH